MHKVVGKKSTENTVAALTKMIESVPYEIFKTVTFDNGIENYQHYVLTEQFGIDAYFCKSFSPCKTPNEVANDFLQSGALITWTYLDTP